MKKDTQSVIIKKSRTSVRRRAGRPRKKYTGLAGQKRNSLAAKGKVFFVKEKSGITYARIQCVCDCGRLSTPRVANFLNGNSKTCDHAARNRFISFHDTEAAQLPTAVVKELGDTYYPKGAINYPDKHRRRYALAAMNNISLATFDFAMRNYRQLKGWIDNTAAKAGIKDKTDVKVVKATAKDAAKAANKAWIAMICRASRLTRKVAFVSVQDAWRDFYRWASREAIKAEREVDRREREVEKADREYFRECLNGRSVWAMDRSGSNRS
jgi:hypothetical protein